MQYYINDSAQNPEHTASPAAVATSIHTLRELENKVREHQKTGLLAGEALQELAAIIKKRSKERKVEEEKPLTWCQYCQVTFGFTPQYANRLIDAAKSHSTQKKRFDDDNRSTSFSQLPDSVHFWEQVAHIQDLGRCNTALDALFDDDGKLQSDWPVLWKDSIADCRKKKVSKGGNTVETEALASKAFEKLSEDEDISSALAGLSTQDRSLFVRTLAKKIEEYASKEDGDEDHDPQK